MVVGDERPAGLTSGLTPETRDRAGGYLLLAAGAILLFVSLFLDWFEPGLSAWTTFEVWDIVLAALALAAVAAAAGALGLAPPMPERLVLTAAIVAPLVVVVALLNHPPAAQGTGQDPMTGIWLALAGSLLMLVGAALAVARISVALNVSAPGGPTAGRSTRFARTRHDVADPVDAPPTGTEPTRRIVP